MNRQVRYEEFVSIMRQSVLDYADTPYGRYLRDKNKDIIWPARIREDFSEDDDEYKEPELEDVKSFVESKYFEDLCREQYAQKI